MLAHQLGAKRRGAGREPDVVMGIVLDDPGHRARNAVDRLASG